MNDFREQFERRNGADDRFLPGDTTKPATQRDDFYTRAAREVLTPTYQDCTARPLPPDVLPMLEMGAQDAALNNQSQSGDKKQIGDQRCGQSLTQVFDPQVEADKLEQLGKNRLDTRNTFFNDATDDGVAASKELAEEWARLTPDQRNQTAQQLTSKYDNSSWDALPIPEIVRDPMGNAVGINFRASALDWNFGPAEVKVVAYEGQITAGRMVRHFWESTHNPYITDFTTTDPQWRGIFGDK